MDAALADNPVQSLQHSNLCSSQVLYCCPTESAPRQYSTGPVGGPAGLGYSSCYACVGGIAAAHHAVGFTMRTCMRLNVGQHSVPLAESIVIGSQGVCFTKHALCLLF